jgi:erythritol transport system ATP-binding protein
MKTGAAVLAARGISKRYPGTLALDGVDFTARAGQVSAIVGENGAGKSTLMRILGGIERPDSGALELDGRVAYFESSRDAAARGIAMIHQELNILPNLSVTDNIFLGRELTRRSVVDRAAEERETRLLLERLNAGIDPRAEAGSLEIGEQQIVEIARAISQDARVVIMDEPTSALSAAEVAALFRVIADMKQRGVALIYISHHIEELLAIADTVTILRDGRVVAEAAAGDARLEWVVERMTGGLAEAAPMKAECITGEPVLSAPGLGLEVRAGEIVGFFGLMGAGRTPLFETIAGLRSDAATIKLRGLDLRGMDVGARMEAGVALVPESRQRDAILGALSVRENILLASRRGAYVSLARERRIAAELARELRIRAADLETPVAALSGGNQQKVILARQLARNPKLLLLDEPTCGVDVGARAEIWEALRRMAARGMAVMFASSELQEIMELSTRIVVMAAGRIAAQFAAEEAHEDTLVAAAGGRHAYC